MRKILVVVVLAVMALIGAVAAPQAQAQPVDVRNIEPFSPAANYMSLPGFVRYRILLTEGRWIPREEAEQIVSQQGRPTGLGGRVQG